MISVYLLLDLLFKSEKSLDKQVKLIILQLKPFLKVVS